MTTNDFNTNNVLPEVEQPTPAQDETNTTPEPAVTPDAASDAAPNATPATNSDAVTGNSSSPAADPGESNKVKFGLKSFLTICGILFAVMVLVGILTFVIPAGEYNRTPDGQIIDGTYHQITSQTRLPVWRWFTAPFEALIIGEGNGSILQIIALLLVLGGTFNVLDDTGGLVSIVRIIVNKFYRHRYAAIWVITLVMMLLASLFGLQEELLVLFPVFLMFSQAMGWGKVQAVSLVLITTGVGFTVAILNPFTIGICSQLAGISVLDGIWFRIVMFVVLYVFTSLYLIYKAKRDEKQLQSSGEIPSEFVASSDKEKQDDVKKAKMITILFGSALAIIVLSSAIPFLEQLGIGMILMAAAFIIGTFVIGSMLLGSFKKMIISFGKGVLNIAPSIVIIMLAFSVKYIAEQGNILHTIFYHFSGLIASKSPYVAVLLLYALMLIMEFFIPGAAAKAMLLIPLFTLAPIPGISKNIILLVFLFGDGYTNVLYPTCGTLVVGLSLAKVSYVDWLKKTCIFQLCLLVISIAFLYIGIAIGL